MKYAIALLLILFSSVASAGTKEVMKASCRVSSGGGVGSGIVFKEDSQYYYILTAGHVMDHAENFNVEFFDNGVVLSKVPARKEFVQFVENTYDDIGVIKAEKRYFVKFKPNVIPVIDKKVEIKVGMNIFGAGCPNGYWMQTWEARLHNVGQIMGFNMPPVGGQSGSGVCMTVGGKDYVIGLVNWRYMPLGEQMYGGGVLIHNTKRTSKTSVLESFATPTKTGVPTEVAHDVYGGICPLCGLSDKHHDILKDKNGQVIVDKRNQPVLFCRNCKHHHLSYKKHAAQGIDSKPCLLYFGIGMGRSRPQQPYQPLPWEQQPQQPQQPPGGNGGKLPWEQPNQPEQPFPNEPQPNQPQEPEPKPNEPIPNEPTPEEPAPQESVVSTNTTIVSTIGAYILGLISTFATKKFGRVGGAIVTWYAKRKGLQLVEKIENKFEKKNDEVVEKVVPTEYNTDTDQPTPVPVPVPAPVPQTSPSPITNNIYVNGKVPSYFVEFFQHKAKDGERIEDWALFGVLYKEAVNLLRQNRLFFNVRDGVPLQGQDKTADLIDDWVKTEYLKRSSVEQVMTKNAMYHEAMLGFLYKEAIAELRKGEFRVLGAEDTANTIDRWVRNELLKRVNISQ